MDPVAIARWQFGVTTVYHFLFVPITIAMSMLVAVIQTIWVRTGKERYLRVVTGIVQEFQFGMNWSEYSRFVGDVFGAPLALEALIAFFLESTFLGLWIFGWDKLPKKIHLACIYAAAIGTMLSSIFILAANSWMQNPVGTKFNTELNRAELDGVGGFLEVLSNPLLMSALPHVIFASYMVAGGLVAGISAWHLAKPDVSEEDAGAYRWATKFGAWVLIAGSALTFYTGDAQAKAITQLQPSKIAAAEGAFEDTGDFSLLTIPNADQTGTIVEIKIPLVLSFIAGVPQIKGIDTIREQYAEHGYSMQNGSQTNIQGEYAQQLAEKYGHIDPIPNVNATYWSFRMMMAFGGLGLLIGVYVLWVIRGGRTPKASKLLVRFLSTIRKRISKAPKKRVCAVFCSATNFRGRLSINFEASFCSLRWTAENIFQIRLSMNSSAPSEKRAATKCFLPAISIPRGSSFR